MAARSAPGLGMTPTVPTERQPLTGRFTLGYTYVSALGVGYVAIRILFAAFSAGAGSGIGALLLLGPVLIWVVWGMVKRPTDVAFDPGGIYVAGRGIPWTSVQSMRVSKLSKSTYCEIRYQGATGSRKAETVLGIGWGWEARTDAFQGCWERSGVHVEKSQTWRHVFWRADMPEASLAS